MDVRLEVICTTADEARAAESSGADRIELIAGIEEGGLSPGGRLVAEIAGTAGIPVHVMVRPHSRSFCYTGDELRTMANEIRAIKRMGAAGVVWGVLDQNGQIDRRALEILLKESAGMSVTFHRAFDEVHDQLEALHLLLEYPGVTHLLTSGGRPSVLDAEERMVQLRQASENTGLSLIAGAGLRLEHLAGFLERTGVSEVHLGSGVRLGRSSAGTIDPDAIRAAKTILSTYAASRSVHKKE